MREYQRLADENVCYF